MSRLSPFRLVRGALPGAAALALFAGACDRTPPTQPGVAESATTLGVGPPPRTADITVSLQHPAGNVVGIWNFTYINADNGAQSGAAGGTSVTVNCSTGPCQAVVTISVASDGCFLARPIHPTSAFPLAVPPPDPNDLDPTPVTPAVGSQPLAAVMTASDGSGGYTSSAITGAEFARSCVRDGAVAYNNGGQGPNPVTLTPPDGLQVDLDVLNPGGQSLGSGNATTAPDGYGLIPLCESALPSAWRQTAASEGRQSFQGLAIGLTGNPGNVVPLFVASNSWAPYPCSPGLPFFVFESDIVVDTQTGTQITATQEYFQGVNVIQTEPVEGEYLLCKQEVFFEALSDGDPTKVDFRGVNTETFSQSGTTFTPFTALKFGFQGAFGENQAIAPLTTPGEAAIAIRYEHVGSGDATLSVRARNTASGTMSGQFPYTCGGGTCSARSPSGSLASGVNAVLSFTHNGYVNGRPRYGITWSLTRLPSARIEWSLSTAGDDVPSATKSGSKKKQVSSAFIEMTAPSASECEFATNDDRWFAR